LTVDDPFADLGQVVGIIDRFDLVGESRGGFLAKATLNQPSQ
jgi:hypothetical protein